MEAGIVARGGVARLRVRSQVKHRVGDNDDQEAEIRIVLRALKAPLRAIVQNAGDDPSVVISQVLASNGNHGYTAATSEYGDLVNASVVAPTKVTRTALQNAASVADLILTTDATLAEYAKTNQPAPATVEMVD